MNTHFEVCLLDFGGGCEISPSKLKECWKIAQASTKQLCHFLEQTLKEADEKAQQARLDSLKQQQDGMFDSLVTHPPPNTPYFEQLKSSNVEVGVDSDHIVEIERKAEETYRQQALDYTRGHVASKVREDRKMEMGYSQQKGKSLLVAMLKSANQAGKRENADDRNIQEHKSSFAHDSTANLGEIITATTPEDSNKITDKGSDPAAPDLDDDEDEEAPTILKSEFTLLTPSSREGTTPKFSKPISKPETNIEAVDFSMAIKNKKKKSKNKK